MSGITKSDINLLEKALQAGTSNTPGWRIELSALLTDLSNRASDYELGVMAVAGQASVCDSLSHQIADAVPILLRAIDPTSRKLA